MRIIFFFDTRLHNFIFHPCSNLPFGEGNFNLHPHIPSIDFENPRFDAFIHPFTNADHLPFLIHLRLADHSVLLKQHQSKGFIAPGQFILLIHTGQAPYHPLDRMQQVNIKRFLHIQKNISRQQVMFDIHHFPLGPGMLYLLWGDCPAGQFLHCSIRYIPAFCRFAKQAIGKHPLIPPGHSFAMTIWKPYRLRW